MATGVGRGKMQLAAFDGAFPKTFYKRKNLAKISYASKVIGHYVSNFVAMATGVDQGKIKLAAFDGVFPKFPIVANISRKFFTQSELSPILFQFLCHSNEGRATKNAIVSI